MYLNYPCGLALAHNGNLTNTKELQAMLQRQERHLETRSDSEVLLNLFAEGLRMELAATDLGDTTPNHSIDEMAPSIFEAVRRTMQTCKGAYSVLILIRNVGVVAFRDPWGIRPLVLGRRASRTVLGGVDYMMASESAVLDTLGFELLRDVSAGECVACVPLTLSAPRSDQGLLCKKLITIGSGCVAPLPCLFEYIYFARGDSVMNGIVVEQARRKMGEKLARKILQDPRAPTFDVVVGVPETACGAAQHCARSLNVPYVHDALPFQTTTRPLTTGASAQRYGD